MQWNFYRVCKDHLQVEVVMLNLQSNIKRVKYGEWFAQQCDNDGLIGYIARRLLNKPFKSSSTLSKYPRLSLRFMANYYFCHRNDAFPALHSHHGSS
ncbi:hypothetical protein EB796_018978 [Bugula neritina]|uniref:Uncharacterized protein n=1 Tax=Bugula neritina TaxID=10212 RepID=A0A7J7J8Z0_BUGNE|nr:hypothetical protein EB796_018978 [Bugula neritina]